MSFFRNFWAKDDSTTGSAYHSHSYHNFFEGYVEQRVTDPKSGKTKIERVYTADYISRSGSDNEWIGNKIFNGFVFLISLVIFFVGCYEMELIISNKYIELFPSATIIIYFYFFYILIKFLSAPRKMTAGEYHAYTPRFYKTSRLIMRMSLISIVCVFLNCFLARHGDIGYIVLKSVISALSFLIAGLLMMFIGFKEDNTIYDYLENENVDKLPFGIQINS